MADPSEVAAGHVSQRFKALVLVPSYNTGRRLIGTVEQALSQWGSVWVVVDGSDDGSADALEHSLGNRQDLRIIKRSGNGGKGAAILTGARQAWREGFTHVLCLDADGQHPDERIPAFFDAAWEEPVAMILGQPVFDDSAPAVRVQGRKLSNCLVALEILGSDIGDALYGMRVYPLRSLVERMESISGGRRYDFEPEIAVRLFWDGVPVVKMPAPVRYFSKEEGGVSHFHYLRDNARMIKMHARILPEFLVRIPKLVRRRRIDSDELRVNRERLSEKLLPQRIARRFDTRWHRGYTKSKLRSDPLYAAVGKKLENAIPGPVLDVGCGIGLLGFYLRETGFADRVIGVDYDAVKIGAARRAVKNAELSGLDFRVKDARDTFAGDSVSHVALLDVLQYITPSQRTELLVSAARAVPRGGLIIIRNCLNDGSWRYAVTRGGDWLAKKTFWMRDHAHSYPKRYEIDEILCREGFQGRVQPLWGRTPFSNYFGVYEKV